MMITSTCPHAVGHAETAMAATRAIVARSRSGHSARAIPQTAWATTATAADLQAVKPPGPREIEFPNADGEGDQRDRRREREPEPGGEPAEQARAEDPEGDADLAARGPRQELAEGHQIGVCLLVDPLPPDDVFVPEVAEMRDRSAERREAQSSRGGENLEGASHCFR